MIQKAFQHGSATISHSVPQIKFFNLFYEKGVTWYREQMPKSYADQITMEKTPHYFVKKVVPERVQRFNKTIKLILLVRDPVSEYACV